MDFKICDLPHLSYHWEKKSNWKLSQLENLVTYRPPRFEKFALARKEEFLLGRYCGNKALESLNALPSDIEIGENRRPLFPQGYLGSITHSKTHVLAIVVKEKDYLSIGVDWEQMIAPSKYNRLKGQFLAQEDTKVISKTHHVEEHYLGTLIFSAKEALYKTLNPLCNKFFGFQDAFLYSVDWEKGEYFLELKTDLSFTHNKGQRFRGTFSVDPENGILALIKLPRLEQ